MTTGERIKKRRLELGLSQEELAHRLGNKSRASVCTVENDKEDLTTDRIRKYADALETTPAYLMGWEDDAGVLMDVTTGSERTQKAVELYDRVMSLPPADQTALLTLLESLQKKP